MPPWDDKENCRLRGRVGCGFKQPPRPQRRIAAIRLARIDVWKIILSYNARTGEAPCSVIAFCNRMPVTRLQNVGSTPPSQAGHVDGNMLEAYPFTLARLLSFDNKVPGESGKPLSVSKQHST